MTVRTVLSPPRPLPTTRRTLVALAVAGALVACGDGGDAVASGEASPTALSCPFRATEVPAPEGVSTDLGTKPEVAPGTGEKPTELQYFDIVEGDGEQAQTGDQVEVKYVGAFWETGEEFDSSWSRGEDETLPFGVCRQGVVPGFSVAPTGMKVGGRRQVVLPPEFAYGAQGSPPTIPANSTLVFVIDLVEVGKQGEPQ
jgi:FKBP-type peptidyl-prolyl cis-trans isomerase